MTAKAEAPPKRMLNVKEAAEYTGFAVQTLYGWVATKRIPSVKLGGGRRFDIRALDRWIEEQTAKAARR